MTSIPTADRISVLPDSILSHILSFLPTKHAATTSVLSKRWKPLWLSLFALHFDFTSFRSSPSKIISAMYSIMRRRETTLPIHLFRFRYPNSLCNQNDMNLFIEYVWLRGVQNFTLDLMVTFMNRSYELPRSVLKCDTLEVLKLKDIKVGDISHMQDLHLPKLKTLHLKHVIFQCNQHLYNLLLSCPVLQDFESKYSVHLDEEEESLPETFKFLSNLIKAKLSDDLVPLSMLRNTVILGVDMNKRWCFISNLVVFRTMPIFQRLTHLQLSFQDIYWFDRCMWLLAIVKYSPKLQNLIIQNIGVPKETNNLFWKDPQTVPECVSSKLKTCCISGYKGTKWDFSFAKYILENSKVLNTMTIRSNRSLGINEKHQMLDELSSYTRASTTCKLLFD